MKRAVLIGATVLAIALLVERWRALDDVAEADTVSTVVDTQQPASTNSRARDAERVPVRSLSGTDLDGALAWHADGRLRIDRALRRRFDYLLSALGEKTLPVIRREFEADAAAIASPASTADALRAFDRYTSYLQAVDQMQPVDLARRLEALHGLRVSVLGPDMARAFFEDEELADQLALDRRNILAQGDMSDAEKQAALDALNRRLSPDERALLESHSAMLEAVTQTSAFDEANTPADVRFAQRQAKMGVAAAQRFAALDEQHARWNARIAQYRVQRLAIEANTSLTSVQKQEAVDALLAREFSPLEQRRVRATE